MYKIGLTLMVRARPEPITPRPSLSIRDDARSRTRCQSGENGDFISLDFPENAPPEKRRFFSVSSRLSLSLSLLLRPPLLTRNTPHRDAHTNHARTT